MITELSLYKFLRIVSQNKGLSSKKILHLVPWLTKSILLEPVRWVELVKYRKAIANHQLVDPPLFILGHYRSGTTFLQRMFIQDKRFGYTSVFQTVLPEIMLTSEKALTPILDSFSRTFRVKNPFHRIQMEWKEFPGEEDVAMTALFQYTGSQWGQLFPRSFEKYFEDFVLLEDQHLAEKWKQDYLYFLKKISLQNAGKPMVLKNPPNTARIKVLLDLFPDAKFIHIVREPLEVFASTKKLWNVIDKHYRLGKENKKPTDELILYSYCEIMDQYHLQKDLIPSKNLAELRYEDFIRDPVTMLRSIYTSLQLFDFDKCEPAMIQFAEKQRSYKVLDHDFNDETRLALSERLAKHIHYWQSIKTVNA